MALIVEDETDYTSPWRFKRGAEHLNEQGWIVVPLLERSEVSGWREKLMDQITKSPEFRQGLPRDHPFAKTGFGTLGEPQASTTKLSVTCA